MLEEKREDFQEWIQIFHGTTYIINLTANDVLLTLEIEDEETTERWSGEFTAQYIEEITHKAGNFKKFPLFVKMLFSAFAKDNDSVYVDVLTLADLEMMKAKKLGSTTTSAQQNNHLRNGRNHLKRYAILTYTGQFDRVHYPLPLAFEESPNVVSLQKTIRRLRKSLKEKNTEEVPPASDKERELRHIVSQLRQENQELKHQLRHSSSRGKLSGGSPATPFRDSLSSSPHSDSLLAQNSKLKKQVEDLNKQLSELSLHLERMKVDKWQQKIASHKPSAQSQLQPDVQLVAEMQKKILSLERELKLQKLSRGVPSASRSSTAPDSRPRSSSANRSLTGSPASHYSRELNRSQAVRSQSPQTATNARKAIPKPPVRSLPPSRHASPSTSSVRSGSAGSTASSAKRKKASGAHSNPSSSSLGGRFDPTAYQKVRHQQLSVSPSQRRESSLAASKRYDSPSSIRSQGSRGSRGSRGSHLSDLSSDSNRETKRSSSRSQRKKSKKRDSAPSKPLTNEVTKKQSFRESSLGGTKTPPSRSARRKPTLLHEISRQLEEIGSEDLVARKPLSGASQPSKSAVRDENRVNYEERVDREENFTSFRETVKTGYQQFEERVKLIRRSLDEELSDRDGMFLQHNRPPRDDKFAAAPTLPSKRSMPLPTSKPSSADPGTSPPSSPVLSGAKSVSRDSRDSDLPDLAPLPSQDSTIPDLNQRISALNAYLENARSGISAIAKDSFSLQSF